MATITVQDLQDIAVKATSDFFNSNIPLNTTLAKEASARGLNSEQVQRAVEATNTLTHLKTIELAGDRTAEFNVADYKSIIKLASVPTSLVVPEEIIEKSASLITPVSESAQVKYDPQELLVLLVKEASVNEKTLEDKKLERIGVANALLTKSAALRSNPQIHELLSASSATDAQYGILAKCLEVPLERRSLPSGMFKSASVGSVEELVSLCKQAADLGIEISERQRLHDKWLEKKAFLGAVAGLAGKALGSAVKSPFKAVGSAAGLLGRGMAGAGKAGFKATNNALAGTRVGKAVGMKTMPISPVTTKNLKRIGTAGTAAMYTTDALYFKPKIDPVNDNAGKVWDALQN